MSRIRNEEKLITLIEKREALQTRLDNESDKRMKSARDLKNQISAINQKIINEEEAQKEENKKKNG